MITLYIFRISKHPDRPSYINTLSEILCLGISHFSPTLSSDFLLSYLPFLFSLFHPSHFFFHFPCSSIFLPSLLSFITPLSFFFPSPFFPPSSPPVLLLPPLFLTACFAWSFHLVGTYCWLHICCGVSFTSVNGWQERLITPRSPSPWLWAYLMNKYINKKKTELKII